MSEKLPSLFEKKYSIPENSIEDLDIANYMKDDEKPQLFTKCFSHIGHLYNDD